MRGALVIGEVRAINPTGEQTDMRSQPKIVHYANLEDEATDNAYEVFRFYKVDGSLGPFTYRANLLSIRGRY